MKKRTKFLLKCLEICSDYRKFEDEFDSSESLAYFCNAAEFFKYSKYFPEYSKDYYSAVDLFSELYLKDAQEENKYNFYISDDYDSWEKEMDDNGYFGWHRKEEYQNHRLMAIALAAAISETED